MANNTDAPESSASSMMYGSIPLPVFYGVLWAFFALCVVVFIGRVWIRLVSLRKLIVDDFIMLFVLCCLLAATIISQLLIGYIYVMQDVATGLKEPPPTFREDVVKTQRGNLALQILLFLGLWGVKLNFLLFFYRIFCSADSLYRRLWWAVLVVTVLSLGVFFGFAPYKCVGPNVDYISTQCNTPQFTHNSWVRVQVVSSVDVFNDILIMIFPIAIIWRVRISYKKKLYLSLIFMFTLFTMATAIIRGSISYRPHASDYFQPRDISWLWFWLQMELIVLLRPDRPRELGRSWLAGKKMKRTLKVYDSLVDTCIEWEGVSHEDRSRLQDPSQTLVLSQLESRTQVDVSSHNSTSENLGGNDSNEIGWGDNWIPRTAQIKMARVTVGI
ncbi:hypothetical protein F4810DRAFT_719351 [Camillea tinctor]|nr:hypothetical protein F4810DRAFT_719351 [Camillea tinctor]